MRGDLPAGILSSQVKVVFRHQYHSYYSDKVPKKGWGTVALEKKDILSVKMFGNFSMLYNGVSLSGQKIGESQFITLMQLLIHNRNRGVSRDMVEEDAEIFEKLYRKGRDTADPDERVKIMAKACEWYTGEFLKSYSGEMWIATEAKRY